MASTLNMFDLIFIFGSLLLIVIAFFRGFVREFFSLINWLIAISLLLFLSPFLSNLIDNYTSSKIVANIISGTVIFIAIFIVSSLATRRFADVLHGKIAGTTDQILGVVYGVLKALLIFGFIYSAAINLHSSIFGVSRSAHLKQRMPDWLYQAKTRPVIAPFGNFLDPIVRVAVGQTQQQFLGQKIIKTDVEPVKKEDKKRAVNKEYDNYEPKTSRDELRSENWTDEKVKETGYTKKEIEKMNRLIEIVE